MPKIKVENVTKIFGRQERTALKLLHDGKTKERILKETGCTVGVNQASFTVYSGEMFVIMGLSGSGKSTLIRLLNRLIEPTNGNIYLDHENIVTMSKDKLREFRRQKMSMVFQKFALFPHRTVLENVAFGLEIQGRGKQERLAQASKALQLVGLQGWEEQLPEQLSGGMQQRVGLARALANNPDILLMDEAFSALDPLIRKEMQDELIELQSTMQKTILFITHDLDEALRLGDRIALMKDGEIVQVGTPEEILMHPVNDYVQKFVEDVNLSKVLTAGHVMKRAEAVNLEKDGLRVALKRMQDQGLSSIYVVNREQKLMGAITAEAAAQAVRQGETDLTNWLEREIHTTSEDKPLKELFEVSAKTSIPVAVVDAEQRLKGVVIRGAILAALAGNGNGVSAE